MVPWLGQVEHEILGESSGQEFFGIVEQAAMLANRNRLGGDRLSSNSTPRVKPYLLM